MDTWSSKLYIYLIIGKINEDLGRFIMGPKGRLPFQESNKTIQVLNENMNHPELSPPRQHKSLLMQIANL